MPRLPVLVRKGTILALAALFTGCFRERVRLGGGPLDASVSEMPAHDAAGSESSASQSTNSSVGETADSVSETRSSGSSTTPSSATSEVTSEADAGSTCVRGQVAGEEVLWIGDSWLRIPGNQETGVESRAQEAGVLGANETYTNRAQAASFLTDIVEQYETEMQSGTPPKVVIMNGGTWDTIQRGASTQVVGEVVAEFEQFLAQLAADGSVEHVVYMLCPELPTITGVPELRPSLVTACNQSTVPCHFLDLQPLWQGHPEYTDQVSNIQASVAGAEVIAEQIWSIMQDQCIAQ